MKQEVTETFFSSFLFWLAVAYFINFSGNFLLFLYSYSADKAKDFKTNYTVIYSTVTITKNILLCIAVAVKENTTNSFTSKNTISTNPNPLIFTPNKTSNI